MTDIHRDFFSDDYTPPTSFYFDLKFKGRSDMDRSFQEVLGVKLDFETQQIIVGGTNFFEYELPTEPTSANLIFKRCLVHNSTLDVWYIDALENFHFTPMDRSLSLLGANGVSMTSLELSAMHSISKQLAIETLKLNVRHSKRVRS